MILQILQQVWQAAGPQLIQFVNNPAALRNTGPQIARATIMAGQFVSNAYNDLSPESKEKVQATAAGAARFVVRDVAGDLIDTYTGLPIGSFVVDKTLALFGEDQDTPK
jgi:hypothetical protein